MLQLSLISTINSRHQITLEIASFIIFLCYGKSYNDDISVLATKGHVADKLLMITHDAPYVVIVLDAGMNIETIISGGFCCIGPFMAIRG